MCRNIKKIYNVDPPASDEEIREAALQFVRKISGFSRPSVRNEEAFHRAVNEIAHASRTLLESLVTDATPRDRQIEAQKAHTRAVRRFGS